MINGIFEIPGSLLPVGFGEYHFIIEHSQSMNISDYERLLFVLAEKMESSLSSCIGIVSDKHEWVDSTEEALMLARRFRGLFVASIVGEIEEKIGRSFSSTFEQLPINQRGRIQNTGSWICP